MYRKGDRVVYPMHGAGVIEAVEEREVLGERTTYYVLQIAVQDMRVMIPTSSSDGVGLRHVIGPEGVTQVLEVLRTASTVEETGNWNHRYRQNLEKIRTGDVFQVAEVVRALSLRDRKKGLSTGEHKMLDTARKILLSELVLARGIGEDEARDLMERALA